MFSEFIADQQLSIFEGNYLPLFSGGIGTLVMIYCSVLKNTEE
jgi:hypothetical protein